MYLLIKSTTILLFLLASAIFSYAQDGVLDNTFTPGTGASGHIYNVVLQQDGKMLVCGTFQFFNSTARNRIARLNANGSLDASFAVGIGANDVVQTVLVQPDGKVIISGYFSSYQGTSRNRIARLNTDGSLDTTFTPGTGANNSILHTALQPDGKILIGGFFNTFNGIDRVRVARLNADGSVDTTFDPGNGPSPNISGGVYAIAPLPDGKIMIGGGFTGYDGTPINRIARLNANGTLDTTFTPGTGVNNNAVLNIEVQADGKLLLAGNFNAYQGVSRNSLVRIHPNGDLDTAFNPGSGANNMILSTAQQNDGKILIGGYFLTYNGEPANYLARLHADGSRDTSLITGTGPNDYVRSIAIQPDGKIVLAGQFTSYNGTNRNRIVRLNNSCNIVHTDVVNACHAFTWINGHTYTHSNDTASYVISNANGCDTILHLQLTILESSTSTDSITACHVFTWIDGHTYTESNHTATYTLTNAEGCDSVVTLNLTILPVLSGTDSITACHAYTWIDGHTYTESNHTATYTHANMEGCDSVITLHLTIFDLPDPEIEYDGLYLVTGSFAAYQWYLDGEEIPGATTQSFQPEMDGWYTVWVENEHGCGQMSDHYPFISANTLSSHRVAIHIYPNPAADQLNIAGLKPGDLISIVDVTGRILLNTSVHSETIQLNISTLNAGLFYIQVSGENLPLKFTRAFVK